MLSTIRRTTLATALIGVVMAFTVLVPAAAATPATYQDLRSPDARDAAAPWSQDLRSPDPATPATYQDLRSPDARDAAKYRPAAESASLAVGSAASGPSGFDWVSAAIGAAGAAGLLILLMGLARRSPTRAMG